MRACVVLRLQKKPRKQPGAHRRLDGARILKNDTQVCSTLRGHHATCNLGGNREYGAPGQILGGKLVLKMRLWILVASPRPVLC